MADLLLPRAGQRREISSSCYPCPACSIAPLGRHGMNSRCSRGSAWSQRYRLQRHRRQVGTVTACLSLLDPLSRRDRGSCAVHGGYESGAPKHRQTELRSRPLDSRYNPPGSETIENSNQSRMETVIAAYPSPFGSKMIRSSYSNVS